MHTCIGVRSFYPSINKPSKNRLITYGTYFIHKPLSTHHSSLLFSSLSVKLALAYVYESVCMKWKQWQCMRACSYVCMRITFTDTSFSVLSLSVSQSLCIWIPFVYSFYLESSCFCSCSVTVTRCARLWWKSKIFTFQF